MPYTKINVAALMLALCLETPANIEEPTTIEMEEGVEDGACTA